MSDNLSKNIFKTICYYDALDYPLTLFEIWKYFIMAEEQDDIDEKIGYSLADILGELKNDNNLRAFVKSRRGFYFLKGREDLIRSRVRRDKISVSKIKRLRWLICFLRVTPFVRMILVTGRLALKNSQPKSDWDVLIVLEENKIWTGRTAVTVLAHLLGKRRHHRKIKNRLCLNYFITTASLEIRNKDFFSASEYFFAIPIFDVENYFKKFQLKNAWIKNYKPNYYLTEMKHLKSVSDNIATKTIRSILENILKYDWLEKYLRKVELKKIRNNPNTDKPNSLIEADDRALIFLPEPQGPKVFEKFKKNIDERWR